MTLIESLVALVILALGVLGLIGFQLQTLKDTRDSVGRSRALVAIQDITERMRLNQTSAASYVTPWFGAVAAAPVNCIGATCNTAQLAAFDLVRWRINLAQSLPGGQGAIAVSPADNRQFMVVVGWRENQADVANADRAALFIAPNALEGAAAMVTTAHTQCSAANLTCHIVYVQPFR
jgi:type IV pilus assembly protein PilV